MGISKIKLNNFLIGLIVLLLLGLIGISMFFQVILENANQRFNYKALQVEDLKGELQEKINTLNNLNSTYVDLSSDLVSYTTEFEDVLGICTKEKTKLESDLDYTENVLQRTKTELNDAELSASKILQNLTIANRELEKISDKLTFIEDDSKTIRSLSSDNSGNISCESRIDDIEDYANDIVDDIEIAKSASGQINNYFISFFGRLNEII